MGNIGRLDDMFDNQCCHAIGGIIIENAIWLDDKIFGLFLLVKCPVPTSIAKLLQLFVNDIGCKYSLFTIKQQSMLRLISFQCMASFQRERAQSKLTLTMS